ncbi:phospholipase D-like domain-containing protein [Edaphosphingomonas haloaromaticamans]|uniref:Phospholipase D n=1 Tax=Edaphosphingomonas haloaromaticamans TaxID=653954 RepID=A0A1S1H8W5_9SPHN|nr:phospholipase D-like domain-containing protein [Sphingomonas haloaromaticamans]OHT18547.1 Cardiolipin synthase [Sphingomonas haloaromaticamans]
MLRPGENCWRVEQADRFAFIVDAADYFEAARTAMLAARKSIFLIGWDFDARIRLGRKDDEGPEKLGDFFLWLAKRRPDLHIRLLRWDTGALKAMFRGNTLGTILRWKAHPRITLKLDGAHPLTGSHHQKVVVIDDCLAFCGGIDMTIGRWDRREHKDDDPARKGPGGNPYEPWHDATSVFDGPAARAMGKLARDRWKAATGESLHPVTTLHDCWPSGLAPTFEKVSLGIARTRPEMEGVTPIHEIEQAYLDLIARAKKWIYAESQYFASRKIARAIAQRLQEEDGPEIVIVNPVTAEGWLEPIVMDSARARLVEAIQRIDRHGRFRIYHPITVGGQPIYVHAKVMIVDDCCLRVGSSNFNNRSLRLDTECDVIISADEPGNEHTAETIADIRNELIAEHLDLNAEQIAAGLEKEGSLVGVIEALRGKGRTLVPYELPELSATEEWLADNEILDPEGPDAMFEALSQRSLFKGWHAPWRSEK